VREERRKLWERIAQAEGRLAPLLETATQVPAELQELRARVDLHQDSIISTFTSEVRAMQEAYARAAQVAASAERDAATARQLGPEIGALRAQVVAGQESVIGAISVELRRMQEVTAAAVRSAQESEDRSVSESSRAARIEAELVLAQQHLAGLRASHQEDTSNLRASHQEEISQLRASLVDAEQQLAALRASLANAEQELATARMARDSLETKLAEGAREAAILRMEASHLGELADRLQQVLRSRSWRLTRPLRVLGRLLRGNWTQADTNKLRRGMLGLQARTPLIPSEVKQKHLAQALRESNDVTPITHADAKAFVLPLAPASAGLPDVFVWAVIDWHFRTQRPQHLARALAGKGHRVFYVSNNFVDAAEPGFSVLPLDGEGRLFQVHLNLAGAPQIYYGMPTETQLSAMAGSLALLLDWTGTEASVSIVQHPHWMDLATMVPSPRLVYDCMDHHPGFENNASEVLRAEERLVGSADLVVVTSGVLQAEVENRARSTAIIRNAADYAFFRDRPSDVFQDERGRKVIGYYGAIAEWFDVELVRAVAIHHADALVVLVGADTIGAAEMLSALPNVRFVGEVKYDALPYWLHGFDVCLLPFKVIPLTIATNPVKVYEYLSAGKPVVSVDLPEMAQFGGLVQIASDHAAFVEAVGMLLPRSPATAEVAARQAFAEGQTWGQRAALLDMALRDLQEPLVSVVVLTYNNLEFTKACLSSIENHSDYRNLEVIVVDNMSSDGSRDWLGTWAAETSAAGHVRRLILNHRNAGFAAGNNIGLRVAAGEFVVILNNDTYVTPGWIRTLCAHFRRDATLGLVGPVTNNIGNEAKIDLQYSDMQQMIALAGRHTRANPGGEIPIATAAFFCVAMPRSVMTAVGELDEAFGIGFFEDDDYCRRVEQAGYRIACAEDVFVHHHLSASFNKMPSAEKQALFEQNKATYEAKWGAWTPHAYRDADGAP
jgi:GT2 family glycosyltransferase